MSEGLPILDKGVLAYFCTIFHGLVPCKVVEFDKRHCKVKFTTDRPGYHKGEIDTVPTWAVCPRAAVRRRRYGYSIGPYQVGPAVTVCEGEAQGEAVKA